MSEVSHWPKNWRKKEVTVKKVNTLKLAHSVFSLILINDQHETTFNVID